MPDQTNLKGIENGRAEFAFKKALLGKKIGDEYKKYVKKIPMLIKTNGIGATFAFMFSKGGTYSVIGGHIYEWLKEGKVKIIDLKEINSFNDLTKATVELKSIEYRVLTIEVLAFLNWLKRFADGLIEEKMISE